MLVHVVLSGIDGDLALLAQVGFGVVQGFPRAIQAAADVVAQRFGLFAGKTGGVLQELLGVADQSLELVQQGVLGAWSSGFAWHGEQSSALCMYGLRVLCGVKGSTRIVVK